MERVIGRKFGPDVLNNIINPAVPEPEVDTDPDAGYYFQVKIYLSSHTLCWNFPDRSEAEAWRHVVKDAIEMHAATVDTPDGDLLVCNKILALATYRYRHG